MDFLDSEDLAPKKQSTRTKTVYIYENSSPEKPCLEFHIENKKLVFKDIMQAFKYSNLRLFDSEGVEYYEDDLGYIKNSKSLYASRGEEFECTNCFSQYHIRQKLGEGGFGQVYLAESKNDGKEYAIKIIKTDPNTSSEEINSVFVEAEILKSLEHENIVKIFNCTAMKNMEVAIVMEYLQGGQLLEYLAKNGPINEETAKIFIKQIAKGMLYCHQNNLIHRDLKLENVLLVNSEQKKIKIIDFGIAGVASHFTWNDLDTGSLAYMAPQCFANQKDFKMDGRIDVWAIGVILYCMLNNQQPFKGTSSYEIVDAIKNGDYTLKPEVKKKISPDCEEVLEHCLQPNVEKRFTMVELANHPWLSPEFYEASNKRSKAVKISVEPDTLVDKSKKVLNQGTRLRSTNKQSHYSKSKNPNPAFKGYVKIQRF